MSMLERTVSPHWRPKREQRALEGELESRTVTVMVGFSPESCVLCFRPGLNVVFLLSPAALT